MKILVVPLLLITLAAQSQHVTGKWKTIDDETGEQRSIVEIFERGGNIYGRVIRIFLRPGEEPDPTCDKCPSDDPRYNKKVIGMEILKDMKRFDDYYGEGEILDPKIGKVYRCKLWRDGDELKVRGYWGPFYRTQTWKKVD